MSKARMEYFEDLLRDVTDAMGGEDKLLEAPEVAAALILTDSINGHRKSVLDLAEAVRVAGRRNE